MRPAWQRQTIGKRLRGHMGKVLRVDETRQGAQGYSASTAQCSVSRIQRFFAHSEELCYMSTVQYPGTAQAYITTQKPR